jgi:hypothetical protein
MPNLTPIKAYSFPGGRKLWNHIQKLPEPNRSELSTWYLTMQAAENVGWERMGR